MFGPPADVPGECNARLFLGDDYGDNTCTVRCNLPADHEGLHTENHRRHGYLVKITWEKDERHNCERHGLQTDLYCATCEIEESEGES